MKLLLSFFCIFLNSDHSFAQDTPIVVNAGAKLNDVILLRDLFQYPEFLNGEVLFRDGKVTKARLNYNRLTDEMIFISGRGDTLALDNEHTIKFISIDKDTFYFDQGYILLIKSNKVLKLGIKQGFKLVDKKKETAYGLPSSSGSVSSYSSYDNGKMLHHLKVNEQATIIKVTQYYFGDKYNRFVFATKKNLIDLFPECESQLKTFCKKNKIDFTRKIDLEKAVTFLYITCH